VPANKLLTWGNGIFLIGLNVSNLVNFFPGVSKGQFGRLRRKRPLKANRPAGLTRNGAISILFRGCSRTHPRTLTL